MLTFRQLDDLPDSVVSIMADAEQSIINDMARRIASMGRISPSTNWQLLRLEYLGAEQNHIMKELSKALNLTDEQLIRLFDEGAARTLESDGKIYKMAGYNPVPLAANPGLQQIIQAGLENTRGEFRNLTQTTASAASKQFEHALDLAHTQIVTGGMDYRTAVSGVIRSLSKNGLASVLYPSGRTDHLDVATRRAVLTGVGQTAAKVQLANMQQMGTDLVETTAHHGARPSHAEWQGKVFSLSGTHPAYPNFYERTGYGTGPGLCGWNCRHSFFPFFEGLSEHAYTIEELRAYKNRTVVYNDTIMNLYDATQHQRYIERKVREWKREAGAFEAAGMDASYARGKVREWQARQRDFIRQTGLRRDYFRERVA